MGGPDGGFVVCSPCAWVFSVSLCSPYRSRFAACCIVRMSQPHGMSSWPGCRAFPDARIAMPKRDLRTAPWSDAPDFSKISRNAVLHLGRSAYRLRYDARPGRPFLPSNGRRVRGKWRCFHPQRIIARSSAPGSHAWSLFHLPKIQSLPLPHFQLAARP